jgi:hypothetical protein
MTLRPLPRGNDLGITAAASLALRAVDVVVVGDHGRTFQFPDLNAVRADLAVTGLFEEMRNRTSWRWTGESRWRS